MSAGTFIGVATEDGHTWMVYLDSGLWWAVEPVTVAERRCSMTAWRTRAALLRALGRGEHRVMRP